MGKIVVIGGGEISKFETLPFDRRIVQLARKKRPKALFIPTASGEPKGYGESFRNVYGKRLGCQTDVLYALHEKPTRAHLRKKILSSDIVYVGGGNTLKMMRRWRLIGLDKILKEAYRKNKVLAGLSAGGICWFEYGHSDSMSFYCPASWNYIRVKGLGLLRGIHCPHFDGQTLRMRRRTQFAAFMKKYAAIGIAIDNHCAMEFIGGTYRVLPARPGRKAYRVYSKEGSVFIEDLPAKKGFSPMKNIYRRRRNSVGHRIVRPP